MIHFIRRRRRRRHRLSAWPEGLKQMDSSLVGCSRLLTAAAIVVVVVVVEAGAARAYWSRTRYRCRHFTLNDQRLARSTQGKTLIRLVTRWLERERSASGHGSGCLMVEVLLLLLLRTM